MSIVIVFLVWPMQFSNSKDFGRHGRVFLIEEIDMTDFILSKIKSMTENGELQKHQEDFRKKVLKSVMRPKEVQGIISTIKERKYHYDPSYKLEEDVRDQNGKLIYPKGKRINPFDYVVSGYIWRTLIFIDGDSKEQIEWAINQGEENIIILIKGSPIDLMRKYKRRIYFDQSGFLSNKFGIKQVPALVNRDQKLLLITEVKL